MLLVLPTLIYKWRRRKRTKASRTISIISKRHVGRTSRTIQDVGNQTTVGNIANNEMDTHADTCCAGANWSLMELTGKVCDVNPFLNSYSPIQEIPVARCCTVWTDQTDSMEYLLVGDQMLWFGTLLPNSLIYPNQIRAYGLPVNDDPFDLTRYFGINAEHAIIPFDTTGTVVHFESQANGRRRISQSSSLRATNGTQTRKSYAQEAQAENQSKCEQYIPSDQG